MPEFESGIAKGLAVAMRLLQKDLPAEQEAQGHVLTGKSLRSYEYEIKEETGRVTALMWAEDYVINLEFGVRPERVRYPIQVMIDYWEKRGLTGREAVSAAWATRAKHKREGIPTRASAVFSRTGARVGFASTVLERDLEFIVNAVEQETGETLEIMLAPDAGKTERMKFFV